MNMVRPVRLVLYATLSIFIAIFVASYTLVQERPILLWFIEPGGASLIAALLEPVFLLALVSGACVLGIFMEPSIKPDVIWPTVIRYLKSLEIAAKLAGIFALTMCIVVCLAFLSKSVFGDLNAVDGGLLENWTNALLASVLLFFPSALVFTTPMAAYWEATSKQPAKSISIVLTGFIFYGYILADSNFHILAYVGWSGWTVLFSWPAVMVIAYLSVNMIPGIRRQSTKAISSSEN